MSQDCVLTDVKNRVGWISLNRPKALNSLNVEMVKIIFRQLQKWKNDEDVSLVCITGEGTKGLCAGGDMKALYELRDKNVQQVALEFFSIEYQMDLLIYQYPKPVLVLMDGIVMGGGVGISAGCSHRIVTENTKWSMPEMNIGFFPDVGASYFLGKMPGQSGRYLALTSAIIKAEDVLYTGGADYLVTSSNFPKLKEDILNHHWKQSTVGAELNGLIQQYTEASAAEAPLQIHQEKINKHFGFDTVEQILASLEKSEGQWEAETRKILLEKSPLSLKVTHSQLQKGKTMSLADCFKMEMALSMNFMENEDFYEGVRSVLVDKDRSPKWKYNVLEQIPEEQVARFFTWQNAEITTAFDQIEII